MKTETTTATMITPEDFTRVNNDTNGNPRYVCHFLKFITPEDEKELNKLTASYGLTSDYRNGSRVNFEYEMVLNRARRIGGRKFHNKQYGGGIVFQSYNIEATCARINELLATGK
jgi:hypothetical protein